MSTFCNTYTLRKKKNQNKIFLKTKTHLASKYKLNNVKTLTNAENYLC